MSVRVLLFLEFLVTEVPIAGPVLCRQIQIRFAAENVVPLSSTSLRLVPHLRCPGVRTVWFFPPEAGDYEHAVPAIEQLVAHIDVEVARMRDALDRAVTRRQLLVGFVQDHTGPLADIRRVPPEILSEIFLQSIPPAEEQTSFMRHSGRTPMILAQVCRRWRAVALSTSRLWSTIIIQTRSEYIPAEPRRLLEMWLERSMPSPLSLKIELYDQECNIGESRAWIDILVAHSRRWEILHCVQGDFVLDKLYETRGQLPTLHTFQIEYMPWGYHLDVERIERVSQVVSRAPRLTNLHIAQIYLISSATFPWSQITDLYVDHFDSKFMSFILQHLPNLGRCTLVGHYGGGMEDARSTWQPYTMSTPAPAPITHSRLVTLTIRESGPLETYPALVYCTLPNLEYLDVGLPYYPFGSGGYPDDESYLNLVEKLKMCLMSFLQRSHCPIQTFSLMLSKKEDVSRLVECLRQIPSLVELNISGRRVEMGLICSSLTRNTHSSSTSSISLASPPWDTDLAPNLQSLQLNVGWRDTFPVDVLEEIVQMLRSRARVKVVNEHAVPLARLVVVGLAPREDVRTLLRSDVFRELMQIQKDGMSVVLMINGIDLLHPDSSNSLGQ